MSRLWIVTCIFATLAAMHTPAAASRCASVDNTVTSEVSQEIQRIFDKDLGAMEHPLSSGGVAATWIGPDDSDRAQVKCLGAAAVPYIAGNLGSRRPFGQLLAVRMLGWVGGAEIVSPLATVLKESTSQTIKVSALEALSSVAETDSRDTLDVVARSDSNPRVRQRASEILARYHRDSGQQR
jgi:hypothetical protein